MASATAKTVVLMASGTLHRSAAFTRLHTTQVT
jgi:hypothetical protein